MSQTNPSMEIEIQETSANKQLKAAPRKVLQFIKTEHENVRNGIHRSIVSIVFMMLLLIGVIAVAVSTLNNMSMDHQSRINRAEAQIVDLQKEVHELNRSWWDRLWN